MQFYEIIKEFFIFIKNRMFFFIFFWNSQNTSIDVVLYLSKIILYLNSLYAVRISESHIFSLKRFFKNTIKTNIHSERNSGMISVLIIISFLFVNYAGYFHHHNNQIENSCSCGTCGESTNESTILSYIDLNNKSTHGEHDCSLCKALNSFDRNYIISQKTSTKLTPSDNFRNLYSVIFTDNKYVNISNKSPPILS